MGLFTVRVMDYLDVFDDETLVIDCDRCQVRGNACSDCVVSVLLREPGGTVKWDRAEQLAVDALAEAGMVPRLQLVPGVVPGVVPGAVSYKGRRAG